MSKRLTLEGVERSETGIIVRVRAKRAPRCPACEGSKVSYHSQYQRQLRDLPWQGQPVRIHLRVRRFRCRNRQCGRKIFAERLPGVAAPKARETDRRGEVLRLIGYVLGGLPGSRLLERLGMTASRDTVLRRVKTVSRRKNDAKIRVCWETSHGPWPHKAIVGTGFPEPLLAGADVVQVGSPGTELEFAL